MVLFYTVFSICFLITKANRRPAYPNAWRIAVTDADTAEELNPASTDVLSTSSTETKTDSNSKGEVGRGKTQCIGPQGNFFETKKRRNGTLFLNCKPPTPYCNFEKNICVSKIATSFKCVDVLDGQYPHIADCRGSVICSGGKDVDQPCSVATSYDYVSKSCKKGNRRCVIPNCTGKSGKYVRHPASQDLFVLCLAGVPSSLYICPPSYLYSGNDYQPCDYQCSYEGLYPDIYDKSKYYECSLVGKDMIKIVNFCAPGTEFYKKYKTCRHYT